MRGENVPTTNVAVWGNHSCKSVHPPALADRVWDGRCRCRKRKVGRAHSRDIIVETFDGRRSSDVEDECMAN